MVAIKNKNQILYNTAYKYLLELLPECFNESMLQKYFVGDRRDFSSLEDVYVQILRSAQNYQQMPNVIKFTERRDKVKEILQGFDFEKIISFDIEELYQTFRREFNVTSKDSKSNSWHKWSKTAIDAAKFICDFRDVDDFKGFIERFEYNVSTRMELPLFISTKICGIGFTLACDFLKELGYTNYPKPDVHLIEVFTRLGLSDKKPISVYESIIRMTEDCKELDKSITPYKIDKVIWLVCSGKFYLDEISIGSHKEELIRLVEKELI